MPIMPVPNFRPLRSEQAQEYLGQALEDLDHLHCIDSKSMPEGERYQRTDVPHLIMALGGSFILGQGIKISGALYASPGAYVTIEENPAAPLLKVTWDEDLMLIVYAQQHEHLPAGFIIGRPPGALADALHQRMQAGQGTNEEALIWLRALLLDLIEELRKDDERVPQAPQRWQQAYQYMQRICHKNIGRERIAHAVGMHPSHLSRLFKQHLGKHFTQVLLDVRMQRAEQLLRDEQWPIKQVAERCGFEDPSYFVKVFKKHSGMTPRQFKQQA